MIFDHSSWVHKYLDPPLNGLDVLIMYLENSINLMREYEQFNLGEYHLNTPNGPPNLNSTSQFLDSTIIHVNSDFIESDSEQSHCKCSRIFLCVVLTKQKNN